MGVCGVVSGARVMRRESTGKAALVAPPCPVAPAARVWSPKAVILGGVNEMLGSRDYDEKRDFLRMGVDCPAHVTMTATGESFQGVAKNLSSSGLLLVCDRALPVGSQLEVRLAPDQPLVPPLEAAVRVARVDGGGPDAFEHGVEIIEIHR